MNDDHLVSDLSFRIHHTMLPVADMKRSIAFYTKLLGMKPMGHRFDENRKVEVGHVGYGDKDAEPTLELTKDIGESARRSEADRHLCGMVKANHVAKPPNSPLPRSTPNEKPTWLDAGPGRNWQSAMRSA